MNVQTISAEANSEQVDKFMRAAGILSHSQKMGRALIRTATMRARRSRARSGTFLSTQ
jgi:hypothetical protein